MFRNGIARWGAPIASLHDLPSRIDDLERDPLQTRLQADERPGPSALGTRSVANEKLLQVSAISLLLESLVIISPVVENGERITRAPSDLEVGLREFSRR
jgi:hypothetical protein